MERGWGQTQYFPVLLIPQYTSLQPQFVDGLSPAPFCADWLVRVLGAERSRGFSWVRETRGSGVSGAMGTPPLASGVCAGGGSAVWFWMNSCTLSSPVQLISFLFWLLLATPGAWAADYKVSWGPRAKCIWARVERFG